MQTLYLATDHAAYEAKEYLKKQLVSRFKIVDLGTDSEESVHYPDYGKKLAAAILKNSGIGIALCGSGIGISIQLNRYKGIRATLCRDVEDAIMARKHNNSNVLCLGGRKHSLDELMEIVEAWIITDFEAGRHHTRIEMLDRD